MAHCGLHHLLVEEGGIGVLILASTARVGVLMDQVAVSNSREEPD